MSYSLKSQENSTKWEEDIQYIRENWDKIHCDPYHKVSKKELDSLFDDLIRETGHLNRNQIIIGLARIVAKIGDGHTALWLYPNDDNGFHRIPVSIYLFQGEWRIIGTIPEHKEILGGRITKINEIDIDQAFNIIETVIPKDNQMTSLSIAPRYATVPEVLQGLNIIEDVQNVKFEVEIENRKILKTLKSVHHDSVPSFVDLRYDYDPESKNYLTSRNDGVAPLWLRYPPSLWLRSGGKNYWFQFLKNENTAYINISRFADMEDERIEIFYENVFRKIDSLNADKLILDIRLHGGGNNYFTKPLLLKILSRPKLNSPGKFFVVIGRRTFSAGMHLATKLELYSNAIFVGEPAGGSPNHYADNRGIRMPNSRIPVHFSTMYWQNSQPYPHEIRITQNPEVFVPLTYPDYVNNFDPILDAIFDYELQPSIYNWLLEQDSDFDNNEVKTKWENYNRNSQNKFLITEGIYDIRWYANELSLDGNHSKAHFLYDLIEPGYNYSPDEIKIIAGDYIQSGSGLVREVKYENGLFFFDNGKTKTQMVPVEKFKFHFLWRPGIITILDFTETNDGVSMQMKAQEGNVFQTYLKK